MSASPMPACVAEIPADRARIPLAMKVAYTAFVAILAPYYWRAYGPTNFLYFCDVALLVTVAGLWLESPLLASMQAVAIVLPQMVWCVDFVGSAFGHGPLGMTAYMFDPKLTLFVRGLSLFHGWLPFLLLYMVWKLGYDRRALAYQTICGLALLLICYFLTPAPPAPASHANAAVNINYVFGLSDTQRQTWMSGRLWFAMLLAMFPICIYLPTHLILNRLFGKRVAR